MSDGAVLAVSRRAGHGVGKNRESSLDLVAEHGVMGDAHYGTTVQHRSRVAVDPTQPNLRQVHLIHAELFDELARTGFAIAPGQMGENITTTGIDLLGLPQGARLRIGGEAVIQVTGLRNPCRQLDGIAAGLMAATLDRAADGGLIRKAGIMGIVVAAGTVTAGDAIRVDLPQRPFTQLDRV